MAVNVLAWGGAVLVRADQPETNYTGHYELADAKAGRLFFLDIKQVKSRADVSFSATMTNPGGAAPTGRGKGHVRDGVLSFDLQDNYHNELTGTLEAHPLGYNLSMTVVKVVDVTPLHFYGTVPLKKVSDVPLRK